MPPFCRKLIGVLILACAAGVCLPLPAGETGSVVTVLPPHLPAKRAVILAAEVDLSAQAESVVFWVRMGQTAYRPRAGRIDTDGTWSTKLVWFGGSRAISYFVEVLNADGEEVALSGDATKPYHAYFSAESFTRRPEPSPLRWLWLLAVMGGHVWVLVALRRKDRFDRMRAFWNRVLRPLTPLRGHAVVAALDRLLSKVPERVLPADGRVTPRLMLIRWLNALRDARVHQREEQLRKRGILPHRERMRQVRRTPVRKSDRFLTVRPWPAIRETDADRPHAGN